MGNPNKNESSDDLKKVGNKNLNNIKKSDDNSLGMSAGLVTDMLLGEDGYIEVQCENCHRKYHINVQEVQTLFDVGEVQCRFCGHTVSGDFADPININGEVHMNCEIG